MKLSEDVCFTREHFCHLTRICYFRSMPRTSRKNSAAHLHDEQSTPDTRELRIDKVGVRGLRFPIQVRDKAHSVQNTVATVGMFVDLPKEFKGTHMSRFIEVLNAHGSVVHVENIPDILYAMQNKFHAATSHIEMEFPYFMVKTAPVSGMESVMDYTARFDATACDREIDFVLTVKANVTTLCPCSKAISARGAHNQRGEVKVQVRFSKPIWIEDLIAVMESSASSELYALLKREDEKAVTERAYDNPVFVEDLVRNRSEEHTSELQSPDHLVCRLLLEKKKYTKNSSVYITERIQPKKDYMMTSTYKL